MTSQPLNFLTFSIHFFLAPPIVQLVKCKCVSLYLFSLKGNNFETEKLNILICFLVLHPLYVVFLWTRFRCILLLHPFCWTCRTQFDFQTFWTYKLFSLNSYLKVEFSFCRAKWLKEIKFQQLFRCLLSFQAVEILSNL